MLEDEAEMKTKNKQNKERRNEIDVSTGVRLVLNSYIYQIYYGYLQSKHTVYIDVLLSFSSLYFNSTPERSERENRNGIIEE